MAPDGVGNALIAGKIKNTFRQVDDMSNIARWRASIEAFASVEISASGKEPSGTPDSGAVRRSQH